MANKNAPSKFATVENGRTVYPLLTEDVSYPTPSTPGPTGITGGPPSSVGQMVAAAMRDVLGVRPKDAKAFLAAINQSFAATEIEGRTEYNWAIRTGMAAPSDSGAYGVVQASVYSQAKASITQALTLIDGIYAIRVDVDPKDIEAVRSVVKTRLNEILAELGEEPGPRVQNVDQLFTILTGVPPTATGPGSVTALGGRSLLLRMQTVFGLVPSLARTIDEERNVTNFQVLIDAINALRLTWLDQRKFFLLSGDQRAPLSTQLPRLWRHLDFLAERLQQVYFIMDSVYLGPAERQVIEIDLTAIDASQDRIFLSDLLTWLQDSATGGGRALIEDGGVEGIRTFASTIMQLHDLFNAATNQPRGPGIPAAYFEKRVQESLNVLVDELNQTLTIALNIAARPKPAKVLESTLPVSTGPAGVLVVGDGFYEGMSGDAISYPGRSVVVVSDSVAIVR
jgi:hypothetical protein